MLFRSRAGAEHPPGSFWITPTGMPADELAVDRFVLVADDGSVLQGDWAPSTEWPFHRAVYRARPELAAVVHMHSPHATALACLRRELPAFHYMVAVAGGDNVPCTPYHLFGTEALSQAVGAAFAGPDGHVATASGNGDERIVLHVVEVKEPVWFPGTDEEKAIAQRVASGMRAGLVEDWVRAEQKEIGVSANQAVIGRVTGRSKD